MATGGKREEIDAKIKAWEQDLERFRVALSRAPESVHAQCHPSFMEVYRAKEIVKSRWEEVRGVYRPDSAAMERFHEALASMEGGWAAAYPILADGLQRHAP